MASARAAGLVAQTLRLPSSVVCAEAIAASVVWDVQCGSAVTWCDSGCCASCASAPLRLRTCSSIAPSHSSCGSWASSARPTLRSLRAGVAGGVGGSGADPAASFDCDGASSPHASGRLAFERGIAGLWWVLFRSAGCVSYLGGLAKHKISFFLMCRIPIPYVLLGAVTSLCLSLSLSLRLSVRLSLCRSGPLPSVSLSLSLSVRVSVRV